MKSKQGIWICPPQVLKSFDNSNPTFWRSLKETFIVCKLLYLHTWWSGGVWEDEGGDGRSDQPAEGGKLRKGGARKPQPKSNQIISGGGAGNEDIRFALWQDGHGLPGDENYSQSSWHKLLLFQMKEEVEGEYAERMEGLREIYRFVKLFAFLMEFMMDKLNVCWR